MLENLTSWDKTVRVWNADGTGLPLVFKGHEDAVTEATWSPDGERIVSASNDGTVRVFQVDGAGEPLVLRASDAAVHSAFFSPDGRRIVRGTEDESAAIKE
jgi:WD40 repeat protein